MSDNLNQSFYISDKLTLGERVNYVITRNIIKEIDSKLEFVLYWEKKKYLRIWKWIKILTGKEAIPSNVLEAFKKEYGIGTKLIAKKSERRVALRKEFNDILNQDQNVSAKVINECALTTFSSPSNIKKMLIGTLCPQDDIIKYYSEKFEYPFYERSTDEERLIIFFIKKLIMEANGKESPRFDLSMSLEKRIEYFDKAMWFYENIKALGNSFTEYNFIYDSSTGIKECEKLIIDKINEVYEDSILFPDDIYEDEVLIPNENGKDSLSINEGELVNLYKSDKISKRYVC